MDVDNKSFSVLLTAVWSRESLLLLSSLSSIVPLMRPEKSCSERFWKQSRAPRGLGYEKEARRWKILLLLQASSSKSPSIDNPAELLVLFFGGLNAETYWRRSTRKV